MKQGSGTFCTIFPGYQDFHFFKDPGQIPYRFSRLGWDSSLVCYDRGQALPFSERYLKIIRRPGDYCRRRFNLGIITFLAGNARKIDVLHVFHLTWSSLVFIWFYKVFNRKGFAWLKLDDCVFSTDHQWEIDKGNDISLKRRIKNKISRRFLTGKVDLWSIEDEYSREAYEARYPFMAGKMAVVYNGHTVDLEDFDGRHSPGRKENIILTAGRLGTYQKATDVLLEAFKRVAGESSFDLHLAGPVTPEFEKYAEKFLNENRFLRERIFFHGPLGREKLFSLYRRARIFVLPSRFDSLPNVFPEAMFFRNAIVTTKVVSLVHHIDKSGVGLAVERDDPGALAEALLRMINDEDLLERTAMQAGMIADTLLNWDRITESLQEEIRVRINAREG